MNTFFCKFILVLLFTISFSLNGQTVQYEKIKLKNIEYYLYTVQAGEGLYSISKHFNVTQEEIQELNPQTAIGLKSGEKLVIPIKTNTQNTISTQAIKQQIEFFEHIVLKKQTIFGLCQKYNITQSDLFKYNPVIEQGLKEGMTLKIPKISVVENIKTQNIKESVNNNLAIEQSVTIIEQNKPNNLSIQNSNSQVEKTIHKVQSKETLYSISKLYNVKIEDIIELNPGSEQKIKRGIELIIPNKKVALKQLTIAYSFIEHEVLSKETLYSISKLYNIDIEEIIKYNPTTEKKLKRGSILMIPKNTADTKKDSLLDDIKTNTKPDSIAKANAKPIKIAFLLPFMLQNSKNDPSNDRFLEFYSGALLAINQAKKQGISLDVYSYDTEKSEDKIMEILNKPELKKMDFIVGPAYTNQISFVSDFSRENKINTLIPFSAKVFDIISNPYLIQFNPNSNVQTKYLSDLIKVDFKEDNIVFLEIDGVSNFDEGNEFVSNLQDELRKNRITFHNKILFNELSLENSNIFVSDKKNILFFNSDKFSIVSPYLSALKNFNTNNNIIVFEQNSWQTKTNKGYKALQISPFKFNLNSSEYKKFNQDFSQIFKWEASNINPRYDILGYDLIHYFLNLLSKQGFEFKNSLIKLPNSNGIQSHFKFERSSSYQGFVNKAIFHTYNQ